MSKIKTLDGLKTMKKLADLHRWYNRGYMAHLPGHGLVYPPDYHKAKPDQQLAFRAGYEDAANGRPAKGMID